MVEGRFFKLDGASDGVEILMDARTKQNLTMKDLSMDAGVPDTGQCYRRMVRAKDAKLGAFGKFARALGYELYLVERGKAE